MGKPFARMGLLMRAVAAAIMSYRAEAAGKFSPQVAGKIQADMLGGYESRGKGGKRAHTPTGISAVRRGRAKDKGRALNKARHREALTARESDFSFLLIVVATMALCVACSGCATSQLITDVRADAIHCLSEGDAVKGREFAEGGKVWRVTETVGYAPLWCGRAEGKFAVRAES